MRLIKQRQFPEIVYLGRFDGALVMIGELLTIIYSSKLLAQQNVY